jgi:hypothetical protein
MTSIGVIGSRLRSIPNDKEILRVKLIEFVTIYGGPDEVRFVSGGCRTGGDRFGEEIALEEYGQSFRDKMLIHYPNKKDLDKVLVKTNPNLAFAKINYARNALIARDSDILVALIFYTDRGGTMNTINTFKSLKSNWEERLFLL